MTLLIAIYGAVLASAGFFWQVYIWRRQRKSDVDVRSRFGIMILPDADLETVSVEVTNRSDHTVRVTSLGFETQDAPIRQVVITRMQLGASLPGHIGPRDKGESYLPRSEVIEAGIDVARPVISWARLATGETVRSSRGRRWSLRM